MSTRTPLSTAIPDAYRSMLELNDQVNRAAVERGIEKPLLELIRIRVSQLNGCAFCLRMHTRDALNLGESADRLAVLPAWRETVYFTPAEQAALAIAEEITTIADNPSRSDPANEAAALTPNQAAVLRWAAIAINSFNRIAIASRYTVTP